MFDAKTQDARDGEGGRARCLIPTGKRKAGEASGKRKDDGERGRRLAARWWGRAASSASGMGRWWCPPPLFLRFLLLQGSLRGSASGALRQVFPTLVKRRERSLRGCVETHPHAIFAGRSVPNEESHRSIRIIRNPARPPLPSLPTAAPHVANTRGRPCPPGAGGHAAEEIDVIRACGVPRTAPSYPSSLLCCWAQTRRARAMMSLCEASFSSRRVIQSSLSRSSR